MILVKAAGFILSLFACCFSAHSETEEKTKSCSLYLVNEEPQETPFRSYGNSGISLAHQWITALDPQRFIVGVPPFLLKNPFFQKYILDRKVNFDELLFDAQERWVGKYWLWVLDRWNREISSPKYTMQEWLKRLTGEEWSEEKIKHISAQNKATWLAKLAEKFPTPKDNQQSEKSNTLIFIPSLTKEYYISSYGTGFRPPAASHREHQRYGGADVPNPLWGRYNTTQSSMIGLELNPLFAETKQLQTKRTTRYAGAEVHREWSNEFGLIFPLDPAGEKRHVLEAMDSLGIIENPNYRDYPQFLGGSVRRLVHHMLTLKDFEELCNEYFWRLKLRGEVNPQDTPEDLSIKLQQFYESVIKAKAFSLWVGPVIPAKRVLGVQWHHDHPISFLK